MISIARILGAPVTEPPGKHVATDRAASGRRGASPRRPTPDAAPRRTPPGRKAGRRGRSPAGRTATDRSASGRQSSRFRPGPWPRPASRRPLARSASASRVRAAVPLIGRVSTRRSATLQKPLGRRADDLPIAAVQIAGHRRRIALAEPAVELDRRTVRRMQAAAGPGSPETRRRHRCSRSRDGRPGGSRRPRNCW